MITASIVTFQTDSFELIRLINCLIDNKIDLIYIIDNSTNDRLQQTIEEFNNVKYFWGHGNVGYGIGHNIAIKQSIEIGSIYHIIVNPDISFSKRVVGKIKEYMDTHSKIGLIMPQIVNHNGEVQRLCKLLPTPVDLIGRRFIPSKRIIERRNTRYEMRESGYDKIIDVPFLSGCFMFCRTTALKKVNGFSERYWMYCEDIDICRRIGESYRTVFYPYVSVTHTHKKESFQNKKMLRAHIVSAIKYFNYCISPLKYQTKL
jgi:GT2 family glycosyltransferase